MDQGKLNYWLENKELWAQDFVDTTMLETSRLTYGKLLAAFWDCKDAGDTEGAGRLARQICIREGFMAESFDEKDDYGETPLHSAAANGIVRAVKLLLDAGAREDAQDSSGNDALMVACRNGIFEAASVLLEAKADPNRSNDEGSTALVLAAQSGHIRCLHRLLEAQADINLGDNNSFTPLMWATQNHHTSAVKCLLEHGANVDQATSGGWNALFDACMSCVLEPAKLLVAAGININAQRSSGATPLFIACDNGPKEYTALVEFLLESKADVDGDRADRVPLNAAARHGREGVVRLLLQHGATVEGTFGREAFEAAESAGHTEIMDLLRTAGVAPAEPEEADSDDDESVGADEKLDPRDLLEGARVRCRYSANDNWYMARIVQRSDDGRYSVAWEDGDTKDTIKAPEDIEIFASQLAPEHLHLLKVGDAVAGFYLRGRVFYPATIAEPLGHDAASPTDRIQVAWDDNDSRDTSKRLKHICIRVPLLAARLSE
jgi:ankyrin repeat protein